MKRVVLALVLASSCRCREGTSTVRPESSPVQGAVVVSSVSAAPSTEALPAIDAAVDDEAAHARASAVVAALKGKDMHALAALVDPTLGVRFTPYTNVETSDLVLTAAEVGGAFTDKRIRHWGVFDGSGHPIDLTFAAYYAKFIFDADFTRPRKRPSDFGENMIDNAADFYGADARIFEFFLPSSNPSRDPMDWRALRVVMKERSGAFFVVGIIHAQWTI